MKSKTLGAGILAVTVSVCLVVLAQDAPKAPQTVWDGVYTKAQADRGQAQYNQSCAACHGPELAGVDETPPLTGGQFMSNWNGLTVGALMDRIHDTMPATGPGSLSRQVDADILAYILSSNGFPAGANELPNQSAKLETIKIDASKPDSK